MFKGGTIRVVSPITEDGNRPKIDQYTGQAMYKEDFFPASAKPNFDRQNSRLPGHLKKKIEYVSDGDIQPVQVQQPIQQPVAAPLIKKRGGRPRKNA
jgi:hypothetical protein